MKTVLWKIYDELVEIRKELHAIREGMEFDPTANIDKKMVAETVSGVICTCKKEENDEDDLRRVLDEEISKCIQKLSDASCVRRRRE